MPTGGSVYEVYIAGRTFSVAASAETFRVLGGSENYVETNGDGSSRLLQRHVPWSIRGLVLSIDPNRGDHEYLQSVADGTMSGADGRGFYVVSVIYGAKRRDGQRYSFDAVGTIVDEIAFNSMDSTCTVNLAGPTAQQDAEARQRYEAPGANFDDF